MGVLSNRGRNFSLGKALALPCCIAAAFSLTTCQAFNAGLGSKIDVEPPSVSISSPSNGSYIKSGAVMTGRCNDDTGVQSVSLAASIAGADPVTIAASVKDGAWTASLDSLFPSKGIEAQADIIVTCTDISGKTSNQRSRLYLDTIKPTILNLDPSPASIEALDSQAYPSNPQSGTVAFSGSVKDGFGVANLSFVAGGTSFPLQSGTTPTAWTVQVATANPTDPTKSFFIPTATNGVKDLGGGVYKVPLEISATDQAGNQSDPISTFFFVDQNAAAPRVSFPAGPAGIDPTIAYPNGTPKIAANVLAPGQSVTFRVVDSKALDTGSFKLDLYADETSTTPVYSFTPSSSSPYQVKVIPVNASPPRVLSADFTLGIPDTMPLGEYRAELSIKNDAAYKLNNEPADKRTYPNISIMVAKNAPTVTIDQPASGAYVQTLVATGTAIDGIGVLDVQISIDGTNYFPAIVTPKSNSLTEVNWSYSPAFTLSDGPHSLSVICTDKAGLKNSPVTRNFFIDTQGPMITVSTPQAETWISGSSYAIRGVSDDGSGSGAAQVRYIADAASTDHSGDTASDIQSKWSKASGTYSWSGSLDLGSLGEGQKKLWVRSEDAAGNWGPVASQAFGVDQTPPSISESSIGSAASVGKNGTFTLSGLASDSDALVSLVGTAMKDGISKGQILSQSLAGSWSYAKSVDSVGHTDDGLWTFTFVATDIAGKTATVTRTAQIDTTAPNLVVSAPVANESTSSSSYPIQGTSTDIGGVGFTGTNDVEYSLDGGKTWVGTGDGQNGTIVMSGTSWSAAVSLGAAEGAKTLGVRSTDALGNQSTKTVNFFYDKNPPAMSETGVGGVSNPASYAISTNGTIHLAGGASDTDAMAAAHALTVSVDGGAAQDLLTMTSAPYTAAGTVASWTLDAAVGSGNLTDGVHSFVFTATDIAGKTTSVTRTVTVDTTAPTSVIAVPPVLSNLDLSYWLSGPIASFNGTSSDLGAGSTGVATIYYKVVSKGSAAPAFSTSSWTPAGGTTNWNGTIALTGTGGIGEGEFTLYVAAIDAVGNVESAKTRDFGVDQNAPTASESHATTFATKAAFTLGGTIGDTNALKTISITESKNGGPATAVAIATPVSGTTPQTVSGQSQGWTTASLPVGGVADGQYVYMITVTDVAGKGTPITRTVDIDTTPPAVTLAAIPAWVSATDYTIGGTGSDPNTGASGVASVTYSLDGGAATAAAWTDTSGGANTSGTWKATLTGLAEGPHALSIVATDAAGNAATLSTVNFGVDYNPPNVSVTALARTSYTASGTYGFPGFSGAAWDSNSLASSLALTVSYSKNGVAAGASTISVSNTAKSSPGNAWSWTPFASGIDTVNHTNDGSYVFTFVATDVAGKTATQTVTAQIDTTAPNLVVSAPVANESTSSSSYTIQGTSTDIGGVGFTGTNDVEYSLDGGTTWTGLSLSGTSWSAAVSLGAAEGAKTLGVRSTDALGNQSTKTVNFFYDKNPPAMSETGVGGVSNPASYAISTNGTIHFAGGASDTDAMAAAHALTVSVDGGSAQDLLTMTSAPYTAAGTVASWTLDAAVGSGNLADGVHSFVFTATDIAGKTTSVTRTVTVDTTAPTVSVTGVPGYASGVIPIGGVANDPGSSASGVAKVQYQLGSTAGSWTDASGVGNWTGSLDLTSAAEGAVTLYVRALDNAGNASPATSTVINIDRAAPRATETNHTSALIQSKADVAFAGVADDAGVTAGRQAAGATLGVTKNGTAITATGYTWNQSAGTWSYTLPASLGDGLYTVMVTVTDAAGKVSSVTRTAQIDTTAPNLVVSAPVANESTSSSSYTIQGTSTDIGGVGFTGTNDVEYSLDGGTTWTGLSLSGTSWSAAVSLGAAEGAKTLGVRSTDALGNQSVKTVNFFYDKNPPAMSETGVGGVSNPASYAISTNGTINFAGGASDTDAMAALHALTVSVDGGAAQDLLGMTSAPYTAAGTVGSWTLAVAVGSGNLADGVHSFVFTATDIAGKTTSVTRTVTVDTTAPTVSVTGMPGYISGVIPIGGVANDPGSSASGVAKVQYQLSATTGSWTDASGTGTWTGSLDLTSAAEGAVTLYVRALDNAGNASPATSTVINIDRAAPRATETNHTSALIQSKADVAFAGVADDAAVTAGRQAAGATLGVTKNGTTITVTGYTWNQSAGTWSYTLPASLGDGLYTVTVTVTDAAGKVSSVTRTAQIDTTAPNLVVSAPVANESTSSSSYTIQGTSTDIGGVGFMGTNDVEYSLDGGATWTGLSLSGTSWSAAVSLGAAEGAKTLGVRSTDALGNQSTKTVNFFYDKNPPAMSETGVGGVSNPASYAISTNGTIHFAGAASDTDAMAALHALTVSVDGGAAQDLLTMTSAPYTAAGTVASWTLDAAVGSGNLADGVHSFVFTATDIAGKTTSVTRTVTVDTTAPTSAILVPSSTLTSSDPAYWLSGPTTSLNGTSADSGAGSTGIAMVYYKVVSKGSAAPAFSTSSWTPAGGTTNWNGTIALTGTGGIGEGEFTVYVAAIDAVGNVESAKTRDFGVDQNAPTASESHATTFATKAAFTLGGTIGDTNALKTISITESKNGGPATAVAIATPVSGTTPQAVSGQSQGWTTANLPVGGVADGQYVYAITATDVAGKSTTIGRTVNIDTTAPLVSLTSIPAWISSADYTIGGTGSDPNTGASGVASVTYSLDGGAVTAAAWTDTSGGANTSGTWKATLTGLAEGPHTLSIAATDAAGNATTLSTVNFGVDYNPPNVSVTAPPSTITAATASSFTGISGNVWDSYKLATSGSLSVSYTKNGGAPTTATISPTFAGGVESHSAPGNAWSWTPFTVGIDATGHTNDGIYSFTFTATDAAGKTTQSGPYAVTIDTMAPQITVTAPASASWVKSSTLKVTGVADDGGGSGVSAVYVLVDSAYASGTSTDHSGDNPTATGSTWTKATGTVSFGASLTISGEGTKTLWVKAVDNDGNMTTSAEALSVRSDFGYDATAPSLSKTDSVSSVVNASFTLTGSATDAASGLSSLVVSLDGGSTSSVTVSSGTWSYHVTALPAEGSHSYVFTATDAAGNTSSLTRNISVDITPPAVSFGNIDPTKVTPATAVTIVDSAPKILGSITDATGVGTVQSKVEYSADNGSTWPATPLQDWTALSTSGSNPQSVTFSKDLSIAPFLTDGLYRITLKAADSLGNTGVSSTVLFRLDRNNPVVSTLVSSAPSSSVNASFSISGSASSNNLASVSYQIDAGTPTSMSAVAPGTYSFSGGSAISVTAASLTEGSHTLTVTATSTGMRTGSQTYSFLVDRTAPTPTIATPAAGAAISGTTVSIGGGATDGGTNPSGVAGVDWQLAPGFSLSLTGSTFTAGAAHGLLAGDIVYFSAYAGGSLPGGISANVPYWVSATGLTTTAFEVSATNGGAILVPTTAGSGFFAARVGSWTAATYGSSNWNATLDSTAKSEGSYLLFARATDLAGNASAAVASRVMVDQNAPVPDFSTSPSTAVYGAPFVASGKATDAPDSSATGVSNGVSSFALSLDDSTFSVSHLYTIATDLTTTSSWSFDLAAAPASFYNGLSGAPTSFAGIAEGTHTLYARATDKAGRTATASYSFVKDTTPPAAAYTNLAVSTPWSIYLQAGTKIGGSLSDANGVGTATYRLDHWNGSAWEYWNGTNWTGTTATQISLGSTGNAASYPWTLDMTGFADGHYRLTVYSADRSTPANSLTSGPYEFYIDTAAPTASITNPATSLIASADIGAPTGSAADANLTAATIQLDSNPAADVLASASSWIYPSWNWAGLAEGTHTLTLTATDVAGKTTTATRSFIKDTTKPSNAYNNPASSGPTTVIQSSSSALSGVMTDANGIAGASYTIQKWNYATSTWMAVLGATGASLGSPAGSKSFSWSIDLGSSGLNLLDGSHDGKYQIWVSASDVATPTANALDGSTSPVVFMIAVGNPQVAITAPALGTYQRAAFVAKGSASDSNTITSVLVKVGSGTVDFSSGATTALATMPASLATPSTFTTTSAHGFAAGQTVYFTAGTPPATSAGAISSSTPYYIISTGLTSTQFQVSTSVGGAAVVFNSAGSADLAVASSTFTFGLSSNWMIPALPVSGYSDGTLTAFVKVFSGAGKSSVTSRDFTLDTTAPTVSVTSPPPLNRIVGDLSIAGISSDPGASASGVASVVQYALGKTQNPGSNPSPSWLNASGGAYSWTIAISSTVLSTYSGNTSETTEVNSSGVPTAGTNLWLLPIYLRTVDNAGNVVTKTDYSLILDPNGNIPVVTLTQPTSSGASYGGQVRISGTATQPIWIHDVEVAIDPSGGSFTSFPDPTSVTINTIDRSTCQASGNLFKNGMMVFIGGSVPPKIGGVNVSSTTAFYVMNQNASGFQLSATASGTTPIVFDSGSLGAGLTVSPWAQATLLNTGNSVNWIYDINTQSQYPQTLYQDPNTKSQLVSVQVRAWSSTTVGGVRSTISGTLPSPLAMNFNSTFPKFSAFVVGTSATQGQANAYYNGMTSSGTMYLWGTISSSKGLAKIERVENSLSVASPVTQLYPSGSDLTASSTVDQSSAVPWAKTTITPPASYAAGSFPVNTVNVMITNVGSSSDWSSIGGPNPATIGAVFRPSGNGIALSGSTVIAADSSGNFNYTVAMQIDTTRFYDGNAGIYSFDFRATDETAGAPQVASSTYNIDVDNYAPTSNGTTGTTNLAVSLSSSTFTATGHGLSNGDYVFLNGTNLPVVGSGYADISIPYIVVNAASSTFQLATPSTYPSPVTFSSNVSSGLFVTRSAVKQTLSGAVSIQGSAQDVSPIVSIGALKRVVAYLEQGGQIINMKDGSIAPTKSSIQAKDMVNATKSLAGTLQSVVFPDNLLVSATALVGGHKYKIVNSGDTTWTSVGSADNNSGTVFTASGAATGGGTAIDYTVASSYAASMDDNTETGFSDVNGDGWIETFAQSGNSTNWSFNFDTTKVKDGLYTLHYVVFDVAGNATHYTQVIFVGNNGPRATGVQLGTDINGNSTIDSPGEISSSINVANTNFTVRNKLFSILMNTVYGGSNNGVLAYGLDYSTNGGSTWTNYPIPAWGTSANGVSISNVDPTYHVGETISLDWSSLSPTIADVMANGGTFRVTVTDTTGQAASFAFNVGIQNTDNVPPTIDVAPFGQRYNAPTDLSNGGVNTDSGKTLQAVGAYADNVATSSGVLLGHVEYATDSGYNPMSVILATPSTGSFTNSGSNNLAVDDIVFFSWTTAPSSVPNGTGPYYVVGTPTGTSFQVSATKRGPAVNFGSAGVGIRIASPDLSGQVILRGKYYDNQRIQKITATISGFNGGAAFTVATWSAAANGGTGGLVPASGTGWSFAIDSGTESVSQTDGHAANWALMWDTSKIATVAAANVSVILAAYDFNNNTSFTGMIVDVVPYISSISNPTGQGLSSDVLRSSTGKYSLETSATGKFNVAGFNLGSGTYLPAAYITTSPVDAVPTVTPAGPQNPAATFGTSNSIQIAKTMPTVKSGWLTVFVNSIPSTNNINSNGALSGSTYYDHEADSSKPNSNQWTDDRYLWFWAQTQLNGAAFSNQTYNYPDMIMSGNQPLFVYDNDNNGYNYRTTGDTTTVKKVGIYYERLGAVAANSSGTYYIMTTEDAFSNVIGNLQINRDVSQQASLGGASSDSDNVYEIINEDYGARSLNRFKYPKLIAEGPNSGTQLYATVFDNYSQQLYFISFQNTGSNTDNMTEVASNGKIASNGVIPISGTANASSQYFAMTHIGTGTSSPIAIAYYDPSSSMLKLTYSSNHTSSNLANTGATWTTMTVDANLYNGSDVSMVYDGSRYLYLAYYDSANANLRFARIDWTTKSVDTHTIDSYLSVGTWTNIEIMNGVPYISYYAASFTGTNKSIRIAFPSDGMGNASAGNITTDGAIAANDNYTGTWEAITVPAVSAPVGGQEQFNHTQLGVYSSSTSQTLPVVGWLGTYLEYAKMQPNN